MFFKSLRRRSSAKPPSPTSNKSMQLESVRSADSRDDAKQSGETLTTITTQECRDYELFLEKARKEEERKEQALVKAAKEAERRRRDCNMDPWTKRL